MASDPVNDLAVFCNRLRDTIGDMAAQQALRPLGEQAVTIIVRRTRLGYGVPDHSNGTGTRFKLQALSKSYVKYRERYPAFMSGLTTAKRSNLTFTGQLLDSMRVVSIAPGSVRIGPTGTRRGESLSNATLAGYVAAKGRPFLSLSNLEAEQLVRFYRNTFGDLLRNRRLT